MTTEAAAPEQDEQLQPSQELTKASRAAVPMGISPKDVDQAWRLSQFIASSDLVPKGYKGRPADVLVAIQFGMEVGLPPMAALHSIFVTGGRPSLWGDGFLAVIMAAPSYADHEEFFLVGGKDGVKEVDFLTAEDLKKDDTTAVCRFWRKGREKPRTATFSIAQAKKAGLWSKEGPWQQYPDRMLRMRARGFAGHDAFPDVLRGVRTAEETQDDPSVPALDQEPVKVVRRLSETVAPTDPVGASAPVPADATPEEAILEPVCVKAVDEFLGGFVIHLANGVQVEAAHKADALELDKFAGTTSKVRLSVTRQGSVLILKGFAIVD